MLPTEIRDKQLNIRLTQSMHKSIMLLASINRVSCSDIVREAIRVFCCGNGGNIS